MSFELMSTACGQSHVSHLVTRFLLTTWSAPYRQYEQYGNKHRSAEQTPFSALETRQQRLDSDSVQTRHSQGARARIRCMHPAAVHTLRALAPARPRRRRLSNAKLHAALQALSVMFALRLASAAPPHPGIRLPLSSLPVREPRKLHLVRRRRVHGR